MERGLLFPYIEHQRTRSRLLTCSLGIPRLLSTVQTFFNNLTYVEPCAMVLKGILDPRPKLSVKNSFFAGFKCPLELYGEEAGGTFSRHRPLEASKAFNCSYLQLWLFAMRNFPEMIRITVKKKTTEPRRYANKSNAWLWHNFAALAVRFCFSTSRIRGIISTDLSIIHARIILVNACPSDQYCFNSGELERYTGQISQMIKSVKRLPVPSSESQIHRSRSCTEARNRRCGRPHEFTHAADPFYCSLAHRYLGRFSTVEATLLVRAAAHSDNYIHQNLELYEVARLARVYPTLHCVVWRVLQSVERVVNLKPFESRVWVNVFLEIGGHGLSKVACATSMLSFPNLCTERRVAGHILHIVHFDSIFDDLEHLLPVIGV